MIPEQFIKIAETLKEVESRTAEELYESNKKFSDSDLDLRVWQRIAGAYAKISEIHPDYIQQQKETVYMILLKLTMAMDYTDNTQGLSSEEVSEVVSAFTAIDIGEIKS